LPFADVSEFVQRRLTASTADLVVVEGVGGLMSPIAETATSLDLMRAVGGDSILVVGAYLGAISHGLTALEVLHAHRRAPLAVVASDRGAPDAPDFDDMLALLSAHLRGVPLVAARRGDEAWAAALLGQVLDRAPA
jgi:dethiobiotin synthetase